MCGYAEYASPSDPPKFYRRQTLDAEYRACVSFDTDECGGGSHNIYRKVWSGSYQISSTDCGSAENTQKLSTYVAEGPAACSFQDGDLVGETTVSMGAGTILTARAGVEETQTRVNYTLDITCDGIISEGIGNFTGSGNKQLADEDTEQDAENRAAAATPDWSPCSGGCLSFCSSFRTDRTGTPDYFFGFRTVQTKVLWGAIIGRVYNLRINFARRLLGSDGPFLDLGMPYESAAVADDTSEESGWVDVPNEAGWETVAANCVVTLQPE